MSFKLDQESIIKLKEQYERWDLIFFGESSASLIITIDKSKKEEFLREISNFQLPYNYLGEVVKDSWFDFSVFRANIKNAIDFYENALRPVFERHFNG